MTFYDLTNNFAKYVTIYICKHFTRDRGIRNAVSLLF